ncbi:MAG: hypothetical protein L0K86_18920 [Actinomycetia bacterium]|nr:hypothetical protein [Actinomycetes bacterium]
MNFDPDWDLLTIALRWGASLFDWIIRRRPNPPSEDGEPQRGRHRRDRER